MCQEIGRAISSCHPRPMCVLHIELPGGTPLVPLPVGIGVGTQGVGKVDDSPFCN